MARSDEAQGAWQPDAASARLSAGQPLRRQRRDTPAVRGRSDSSGQHPTFRGERVRVVICDDSPVQRLGLRVLLSSAPDLMLVGEYCDLMQAWGERFTTRPHVVLLGPAATGGSDDLSARFDAEGVGVVELVLSPERHDKVQDRGPGALGSSAQAGIN